jgi:hypothetical protein
VGKFVFVVEVRNCNVFEDYFLFCFGQVQIAYLDVAKQIYFEVFILGLVIAAAGDHAF